MTGCFCGALFDVLYTKLARVVVIGFQFFSAAGTFILVLEDVIITLVPSQHVMDGVQIHLVVTVNPPLCSGYL